MELRKHTQAPKPTTTPNGFNPLVVWLDKSTELIIEPGDELRLVAQTLRDELGLGFKRATKLAGYYFTLGERLAFGITGGNWVTGHGDFEQDRTYLPRLPKRKPA
jgi:hypothetical protein